MLQSDVETLLSFAGVALTVAPGWRRTLEPLDARRATQAISDLHKTGEVTLERFRRAYGIATPAAGPIVEMPEWVKVWWWCRRTGADPRGFPQQVNHLDWPAMNLQEYRDLRDRWVGAGSPSPRSVAQLVGAS